MIEKLRSKIAELIKICKYGKVEIPILLTAVLLGCAVSFIAGQTLRPSSVSALETGAFGTETVPSETAPGRTLLATPSFLFPPTASYSDATPANAEIMRPDQLNLAYLYEETADSISPSDTMAGTLYKKLAVMDSKWTSGIYDLFNYTPQQLAPLLGLSVDAVTTPSGIIEDFKNIQVRFYNGDRQEVSGSSNSRSIVSMANVLYYYGALENIKELEAYAALLWEKSHSYRVYMGDVYYCDGNCLIKKAEQEDGQEESIQQLPQAMSDTTETSVESTGEAEAAETTLESVGEAEAAETSVESADETEETVNGGPGASDSMTVSADIKEQAAPEEDAQDKELECPGHVDLSIDVIVKGVTENESLYKADPIPPSSSVAKGNWSGWNETTKGFVHILNSQDWYQLYGLNTADLLMFNPLTSQEIDTYMSMLPDDASQTRKEFVRYALASVGKIPYYWGGKPSAPGYTGNDFGSVVPPDEDGHFLRGLDCSGWVNWVYWSVTGRGLGASSTGSLISSGTAISKSELLPGDICIRTGTIGHVVIFLGWTVEGKMLCVQETTGNSHNVEIGIVASDWQSYRRIIN